MEKNNDIAVLLLCIGIFLAAMAIPVYLFFDLHSHIDKPTSLLDFFIFFLRELIFVGFLLVVLICVIAAKLKKLFQPSEKSNKRITQD